MKPDLFTAVMKTIGSAQDEKIRTHGKYVKLNDIDAAISRSEKERQNALNESAEAEQNWRARFREMRGMMIPELKAEHGQRVTGRELAEEFTALIDELNDDKARTMLAACTSGKEYVSAHSAAISAHARNEWAVVMQDIPPALVRAFALRLRELEIKGEEHPHTMNRTGFPGD